MEPFPCFGSRRSKETTSISEVVSLREVQRKQSFLFAEFTFGKFESGTKTILGYGFHPCFGSRRSKETTSISEVVSLREAWNQNYYNHFFFLI
jgi:hypothetical protein